jgi:hypothetical protein
VSPTRRRRNPAADLVAPLSVAKLGSRWVAALARWRAAPRPDLVARRVELRTAAGASQATAVVGADQRVDPEPSSAVELFEGPLHVLKLVMVDESADAIPVVIPCDGGPVMPNSHLTDALRCRFCL